MTQPTLLQKAYNLAPALAIACSAAVLAACAGSPPDNLGVQNGALSQCPSSPNCISSGAEKESQHMAPWTYVGTPEQAQQKLTNLINANEDAELVEEKPGYLHAEFTTPLMGFVDDVEFLISEQKVDMRSASRLGYSDWGANRKRLDLLQKDFLPCCE